MNRRTLAPLFFALMGPIAYTQADSGVAIAQVDPGERNWILHLNDLSGVLVSQITVAPTRPASTWAYDYVGTEHWAWTSSPWPDETMTMSVGERTSIDAFAESDFHQAIFPEDAELTTFPRGEQIYALSWKGDESVIGWLVVEENDDAESPLSWVLAEDAEIDELMDLSEQTLILTPAKAPWAKGPFRAIVQEAL